MIDERENKMSGSGMAGYAACAGKFQLEVTCPRDEGNIYTEIGNRIHLVLAGVNKLDTLPEEEQAIVTRCLEQYGEILAQLPSEIGDLMESALENRLWYNDTWSGAIDRIDWFGDFRETALVVDWKTGRTPQGNASENLQLRAYAVLVKKNYPTLKRIFVAIVQPLAAPYTIAEYEEIDLKLADEQIQSIVDAAMAPDAKRTPSPDACKYCRAKSICPEAQGQVTALAEVKADIIPALTDEQVADFLEKAAVVESFIEALRSESKKRLQEGHEIAGYKLSAGRTSRSIEDLQGAHSKLVAVIGEEAFLSACKVSVPTLEKSYAAAKSLKGKAAKESFEAEVADLLIQKQGEPVMTRTK
jgi:CRISPR/Cas system-associated exonuclease Cas4 (RecB family)